MYIDDLLIIGKPETNESTINDLKQYFDITKSTTLDDYLGVQVIKSKDQKRAWLGQPTIIDALTKNFRKEVEKQRITLTPGTPGFIGAKQNEEGARINEDQQQENWSGVGTLPYLTKLSRPDIANAVCELSKSMDGASKLQFREMLRVIKFVLDTKDLSLKMVPTLHNGIWQLEAFSDSDFANDKETRISVYGYVIYFCGIPVAWKSKSMRSVVLSTTEAEYVAISEVVKEIKFVYQLLESMHVKVPLPIKVRVHNIGAIWLANNNGVSERTKHVDTRAHFVRAYVINEVVTIEFVKSNENISDIMTKKSAIEQLSQRTSQHCLHCKRNEW